MNEFKKNAKLKYFLCILLSLLFVGTLKAESLRTIWTIGKSDNSGAELSLGPSDYKKFLEYDFGYEDRYFLIGSSDEKEDFPYVLPGPDDLWSGTGGTSGWRTHEVNILFGIEHLPKKGNWELVVDLVDSHPGRSVVKVRVNNVEQKFELKGTSDDIIEGRVENANEKLLTIPLNRADFKEGGNRVTISVLEGSWIVFDQIRLVGSGGMKITEKHQYAFLRNVSPAGYEIERDGARFQPLLVDVEHLSAHPELSVRLDGQEVFESLLDTSRYVFEVPMPAVDRQKKSRYEVYVEGELLEKGAVVRSPQPLQTLADYVDTKIGSAHSRWMIAPGPWMPFSMVKMSPDNQNAGWQAGYQPTFETIGCFSHIHEWTMAGLGMMPTNGPLQIKVGDQFKPDEGYRSRIDKQTEEAPLGYYRVFLKDTKIQVELTATERASFQRYTFPSDKEGRVMIDLNIPSEYGYQLKDVKITKTSEYSIEGYSHQITPNVWSNDADQEYIIHFVIEFDAPIRKVGGWKNEQLCNALPIEGKDLQNAGAYVEFDTRQDSVVQVRTGISLVSVENAAENLRREISDRFHWDFKAVVQNQKDVWNNIFNRLVVTSSDRMEKVRFYSNLYRSFCRNVWSDCNGEWVAPDEKVRKFTDPNHVALGCDALWNTFWNLNQVWNLVTPEWSSRWVNSQLALYDATGWLAKGPAGMEYIPVMVAEHEIPLMVSAYQMGIRDFDADKVLEAVKKMQTTPAGHVAGGFVGNRDLVPYMKYKYVPLELGRFSNTLEYSFDDWCVGQMAKALGKTDDYEVFADRGNWWRNAMNIQNGYAHLRDTAGNFVKDFDPFRSGSNQHYVEGNSWQLSYFVPQDVPALVNIMGEDKFVERLNWGFLASEPWRYNAPGDQYWDFPVVQGNQQSMHFAFLFNWANHPWLTQKWSRSIVDKYYGSGLANAYLGDEDQGQMSAWFVMAAIGLFQVDGGARVNPVYEIASPLFQKVVINMNGAYGRGKTFTIEARNASRKNKYVQRAVLNGKPLDTFYFPASELLKGGSLVLEMSDTPNEHWGLIH